MCTESDDGMEFDENGSESESGSFEDSSLGFSDDSDDDQKVHQTEDPKPDAKWGSNKRSYYQTDYVDDEMISSDEGGNFFRFIFFLLMVD